MAPKTGLKVIDLLVPETTHENDRRHVRNTAQPTTWDLFWLGKAGRINGDHHVGIPALVSESVKC